MDELQKNLLRTLDAKLQRMIDDLDNATRDEVRARWSRINPAPNCPHSADLLKCIREIVGKAYTDRGRQAADAIRASLCDLPDNVIVDMGEPLKQIAGKVVCNEPFLQLVSGTPGVYERSSAPRGKFLQTSYEHELALMRVTAENVTRREIEKIRQVIDEAVLKAKARCLYATQIGSMGAINIINSTVGSLQTGAGSVSEVSMTLQSVDANRRIVET